MGDKLILFRSPKFGKVRGAEINGKGWVAAVDICRAIGFNSNEEQNAVRNNPNLNPANTLVLSWHRMAPMEKDMGWYVPSQLKFVNIPGARLVAEKANSEEAKEFMTWLMSEVFPAMNPQLPAVNSADIIDRNTARVAAEQESLKRDHMQIFKHPDFGDVRVIDVDGEPWFVGKDVAVALGYAKPENALSTHVEQEDKTTTLIQGNGSNYKSKTTIINESGLYSLVLSSKLPQAKAFKRWVTAEVLPSLRKYGAYVVPSELKKAIEDPEYMQHLLKLIRDDQIKQHVITADICKQDKEYAEWARSVVGSLLGQIVSYCPTMTYSEVVEETFQKLFASTMFDVREERKKFMGKQAEAAVVNGILVNDLDFSVPAFYVIYQDEEIRRKYVLILADTLSKAQARQLDRLLR